MKKPMYQKLAIVAALGGAIGMAPHATAAPDGPHLYVGGNYGGYKSRGGDFDEDDDFKEALVGFQFNKFLGIEGGYMDFGTFGGDVGEADIDGKSLAVVGRIPLTDSFSIFAKAGQMFWDADVTGPLGFSKNYDGDEPFLGVGADFYVTNNLAVALEYDRYQVDLSDSDLPDPATSFEEDMDTVKLGLRLAF